MKKLFILFIPLLIANFSFAQKLDNEVYIRSGYSIPFWSHFGLEKNAWGDDTKRIGGNFEFGTIFMIQSFPSAENMAIGINVDYIYTNVQNFTKKSFNTEKASFVLGRAGSKIGPSFSFSPKDKIAFDIYVKANIAWATVAYPYESSYGDEDDFFLAKPTLGYSTGMNFRYSFLMLGIEYEMINAKLESNDHPGEYLQESIENYIAKGDDGLKSKLPCLNFKIGLSF